VIGQTLRAGEILKRKKLAFVGQAEMARTLVQSFKAATNGFVEAVDASI